MATRQYVFGVNAYEANVTSRVGSNVYAYHMLCALEELTRADASIEWRVYIPEKPVDDMPKERTGFTYVVIPPKKLWTLWRLPLALYTGKKLDFFISLGHYAPKFCPCKQAVCVLDLAFLKFPQFFLPKDLYQLENWTRASVRASSHVFTISKSARTDIMQMYGKKNEEITIAYPGVNIASAPKLAQLEQKKSEILSKFGCVDGNYMVILGTIQPRKNILSAIAAYEKVCQTRKKDFKLVLAGKSGWMTDDFTKAVNASPQCENIIVTGFVSEEEKWVLLRYAIASVLVGYYEGFGIPVIESMGLGVKSIVANTGSLPEVVGDYGIRVDPYSVDDIARGMNELLDNPPSTQERSAMVEWAKQFRWIESAKIICTTIQSLV